MSVALGRSRGPAIGALCFLVVLIFAALGGGDAAAAVPGPDLQVTGAALIEASTGQELYGDNADSELAIASTTKIMTALITLQHVKKLDTVFTQNDWYPASVDSQIGLVPGDRMTVHDLLLALMLPSADDAAEDLAYNVGGGSVSRFVGMMNAEAQKLGLTHTHYTTPIGLDTPGNYSSPADLDHLADYVLHYSPLFRRIVDLPDATLQTGPVRYVVNRNDLVGRYPWINGVKTGHTDDAGYVLVASGTQGGMTLIGSVLGTSSEYARDQNALALLQWGFANFRIVQPVTDGQVLARRPVHEESGRAVLVADGAFRRVVGKSDAVTVAVKAPRELSGPLPRHAIVGSATVFVAGHAAARIPLMLAAAIPAVSPLTQASHFFTRGSTLIVLVLALGAVAAMSAVRRRRPRAMAGSRT
jgi:serine-type D-Ala-D-Ala carboxypeptidase (penicillin-binding protein 5/6)